VEQNQNRNDMENSIFDQNKAIAQYLGWKIETSITPDYPTQEWHYMKGMDKNWDGGQCVHLNDTKEIVKQKREEIDGKLWAHLLDETYGRAGRFHLKWEHLMPVVEQIEKESGKQLQILGNSCYMPGVFVSKGNELRTEGQTKIEAVHKAVVIYIESKIK